MKTKNLILATMILSALTFTSCAAEEKSENKKEETEESETEKEDDKEEKMSDLKVKIYFKSSSFDGDGNVTGEEVQERENFQSKNGYTFCYDAEEFHELKLEGNGKKVTIKVTDNQESNFSKEFDLKGSKTFSTSDFNLMAGSTYEITITQAETELFKGKVDSQGCM